MQESYFDGGLLELILYKIIAVIIIAVTFGIATPWAVVMLQKWETEHTVIDGNRLYFVGSATSLFGQWIKWLLLTIITFGIYGFWVQIKMTQWVTKNTHMR